MEYYDFRAMNSDIILAAEGEKTEAGFEAARTLIEALEKRFTRFSESSELSRMNRSAGEWFSASPEMFEMIETALDCFHATSGLFNPAVLPNLKQIGYTRSMDEIRLRNVGPQPAPVIGPSISFDSILLNRDLLSIYLPRGLQIDLGGIAKGWIAERATRLLADYSPACAVSAGGDIFFIGHPFGETGWAVGLEDPRDVSEDLTTLWIEEGAVATSSITKRVWNQSGIPRHHLIDPRSGQPAETNWLSVTVFAPQAATAETFAKAILIGGRPFAHRLINTNPQINFLAVDEQGMLWDAANLEERIHVND